MAFCALGIFEHLLLCCQWKIFNMHLVGQKSEREARKVLNTNQYYSSYLCYVISSSYGSGLAMMYTHKDTDISIENVKNNFLLVNIKLDFVL